VGHVWFVFEVLLCATLFALVETQVEGSNGWASALPTWRIENRWTKALMGTRPLTGYHLYLQLFLLAIVHAPVALGLAELHLRSELRIVAFVIFFWVAEDFLYFVVNPAFGLARFRPRFIWWHRDWWGFMPKEYWVFLTVGLALYAYSTSR
jgi:hypothetical protein